MTKESIENFAKLPYTEKTTKAATLRLQIEQASQSFLAKVREGQPVHVERR